MPLGKLVPEGMDITLSLARAGHAPTIPVRMFLDNLARFYVIPNLPLTSFPIPLDVIPDSIGNPRACTTPTPNAQNVIANETKWSEAISGLGDQLYKRDGNYRLGVANLLGWTLANNDCCSRLNFRTRKELVSRGWINLHKVVTDTVNYDVRNLPLYTREILECE